MAKVHKLQFDGQSVTQDDYNSLGLQAGLSEDHVFAELFRMTPIVGSTARGILPFYRDGSTSAESATVVAAGATGRVDVNPFRAFIGSRTVAGTEALDNWQDVRSGLSVAAGATALKTQVSIGANSSGQPRWDLVYAAVTVDAVSTPVTRKVKNPGTSVVTDESVSVTTSTSVSVSIVAGVAGASPAFPSIPSDAGDVYYVPLAYVRVPTGFGATSTVANKDINEVAPVMSVSRSTGGSTLRPANESNIVGGDGISHTGTSSSNGIMRWTGTTASRPGVYMPPSMQGGDSLLISLDLSHSSSANWSHQSGDVIDSSRDWRNRIFKWMAMCGGGLEPFPWNASNEAALAGVICGAFNPMPSPGLPASGAAVAYTSGFGQSFVGATGSASDRVAAYLFSGTTGVGNIHTSAMTATAKVKLMVDYTTGYLKLLLAGSNPACSIFFWLDASAPYSNY